jgi:hypothetical protein
MRTGGHDGQTHRRKRPIFVACFATEAPQFAKTSNIKTSVLLVARWGAASGCGWRRPPQDMKGSSEYIEYVIAEQIRIRPAAGNLAEELTPPRYKSKYITK